MPTFNYDIAVAYRIYPKISKTSVIFKDDKFKLSEFCLRSFKVSLGSLKVKMYIILDGCPEEYEVLFKKYFDDQDIVFIKVDGIGNQNTFALQVQILLEQNDAGIVFFAEDDYYYQPNQIPEIVEFIRSNNEAHFVTPYDHLNIYTLDLHSNLHKITFSGTKHWRTVESTCLTFFTTKQILLKTKNVFLTYTRGNTDVSVWMSLTKYNVRNPVKIFKYLITSRFFAFCVFNAWHYCGTQILFKRKWNLWGPLPSIATHMEESFLAPTMEKEKIFANLLSGDSEERNTS